MPKATQLSRGKAKTRTRLSGPASAFNCCGALLSLCTGSRRGAAWVWSWTPEPQLPAPCGQATAPAVLGSPARLGAEGRPASGQWSWGASLAPVSPAPGPLPKVVVLGNELGACHARLCRQRRVGCRTDRWKMPRRASPGQEVGSQSCRPGLRALQRVLVRGPSQGPRGGGGLVSGGLVPRRQEPAPPRPALGLPHAPRRGLGQGRPPWAPPGK